MWKNLRFFKPPLLYHPYITHFLIQRILIYHVLRGSDSSVLTAKGKINGKWRTLAPTESKSLNQLRKNCHSSLRARDEPLCQFRCKYFLGGLLGKLVKYEVKFVFPYIHIPFLREQPTGQTLWRILTHDESNDAKSRKDVPFGVTKTKYNILPLFGAQMSILGEKRRKVSTQNRIQWALSRVNYLNRHRRSIKVV